MHFLGQVPRDILQALFNQSAAAVFTGLREEGGLALAEAMYGGAHVIVLDHGGAATITRFGTDQGRVTRVPVGSVDDTVRNLAAAMTRAARTLSAERGPTIDRAAVRDTLHNAFTRALAAPTTRRVASPSNVPPAVTDSVTVVIPACNAERYLRSAAMSVLEQTHRTLTLVIVNDGSSDGTQDVAERIAASDPRVHVILTANRGRACARNIGVHAEPESDFIAFLDADDLWDRTKLAEQLHAMHARPDAAGVGSFMRYVSSSDRVLGETGQAITEVDARQIARGELAPFPISSCLLVRSKVFAEMTGFDEELREAEDLDFIARLARRGPILTIEHSLGAYRIHFDSAMARSRARVNMFARFVRRRFRERDAGRDLAWADFEASYRPSLRERRRDAVEIWYRSAALWRGEGRMMRAAGYAALAAIAAPAYTARRLLRQRVVVLG